MKTSISAIAIIVAMGFGTAALAQDAYQATDDTGGDTTTGQATAVGNNSTAAGFGARVGLFVPAVPESCSGGSAPVAAACPDGETYDAGAPERVDPINGGTALGSKAIVEHNGSTAVGAGVSTTKENQVMIGKDGDTITAPGVKKPITQPMHGIVVVDEDGNLGSDGGALHGRVTTAEGKIATNTGNITTNTNNIAATKQRLDVFVPSTSAPTGSLENWAGGVNGSLASQGAAITANTAMLSEHAARLDEHAKGLAISLAMPDAWLSDKKRFGVFGAVGGFGDETAVGFAAIGRLDETFTLNAKFGSDTSFDEFGWQVGVGAQW
jgi:hypothetical protein